MQEKTYQRKPLTTKAIQFSGKESDAEYLAGKYMDLYLDGSTLYFSGGYDNERVWDGDWILLKGERAMEVIDGAVFESMYEEAKP